MAQHKNGYGSVSWTDIDLKLDMGVAESWPKFKNHFSKGNFKRNVRPLFIYLCVLSYWVKQA